MLTSLQRVVAGTGRLLTLGVLLLAARDGLSLTISPSPSYTGSYVVSAFWTGCYEDWSGYPYYVGYVCHYLEERDGAGTWTNVPTAYGATSWNAAGKAPGTYTYQVYLTHGYGDKQVFDGPVSVTVGTPPPRDTLSTQLSYQFQTRQGDINADGRTDLFVKRTAGGVAGNGVLDTVILRQGTADGSFAGVVPTAYESGIASSWPVSSASAVVTDFNVDGFVDVEVKGVGAALGAPAMSDQIVFSPGVPLQLQPLGVRAVDAALKKFVGNMLDYIVNPNYFAEHAKLAWYYGTYLVYYCSYDWGSYILDEYYSGFWCGFYPVYVSGYYWDYSDFSTAALGIWTDEQSFARGTLDSAQSTERVQQTVEGELGAPIGGWPMEEELGANGEHTDADVRRGLETFWAILGIGTANAQEVETVEAPAPVPRVHDVVYITGRPALGVFRAHTAIEYTSGYLGPRWISAFGEFVGGTLTLVARERDFSDGPRLTVTLGQVHEPGNPNASYFLELTGAARRYDNNLCYVLDPPPGSPCYNSNGFTRGLIAATGGVPTIDLSIFPGGDHPVPANAFQ